MAHFVSPHYTITANKLTLDNCYFSSYRFRARPLNEKIFENRFMGVPRKPPKEPTVAVSPKFATDRRIQEHNAHKEEAKDHRSFHARPIPKGMFEAPLVGTRFMILKRTCSLHHQNFRWTEIIDCLYNHQMS